MLRDQRPLPLPAPSLLQLLWLASPALPVGGFSYSEGLEAAVEAGLADTEASASEWLVDQLHLSSARSDLPLLAKAVGAWRRGDLDHVRELNDWLLQTRESAELRAQTLQMGRSLLDWLRNHNTAGASDIEACAALQPTYPVAFSLAASATQAGVRDILLAYAFGWAENMMSAAIKSVPLGQSAGQRILSRLAGEIPALVEQALSMKDSARQAFTPMLAILSAQHETQYSRLFRS
jgi:urease accessory protein